jgi:hypothetical protein
MRTFLNAVKDLPPGYDQGYNPGERPKDASRRTYDALAAATSAMLDSFTAS